MTKTQTKVFTGVKQVPMPDRASIMEVAVPIEFASTAYASGDLIEVCRLQPGVLCVDWSLVAPDCDSGGGALAFSLGTENSTLDDISTEVWGTAITGAGTGVPFRNALAACSQGVTSTERIIVLKCTTIATTYAGSGKIGYLILKLLGVG